ncbi:hypothetical protein [Acetobacter aceti]|uniref:hypothetical protein n=1 Tax=Acetobacter aceti TaxID=435 RepID=UPI0011EA5CAA|nr:hypothetical protein [Acetobacter aceti]
MKGVVALLTPIVVGLVTVYIAWQQHLLSRTQAKLSQDQRDIAHNKQRVELFEKIYELYDDLSHGFEMLLGLTDYIPSSKDIVSFNENINKNYSLDCKISGDNIKADMYYFISKYDEMKSKIKTFENNIHTINGKCRFIFDANTAKSIKKLCYYLSDLIWYLSEVKSSMSLDKSVFSDSVLNSIRRCEDCRFHAIECQLSVESLFDLYLNISDITKQSSVS